MNLASVLYKPGACTVWTWPLSCINLASVLYEPEPGPCPVLTWPLSCMNLATVLYEPGHWSVWSWPLNCVNLVPVLSVLYEPTSILGVWMCPPCQETSDQPISSPKMKMMWGGCCWCLSHPNFGGNFQFQRLGIIYYHHKLYKIYSLSWWLTTKTNSYRHLLSLSKIDKRIW